MPNSKPTSRLFTISLWLISIFSEAVLVVYAYLGIFSRHLADDYCVVDFTDKNFFVALWDNYINVSDRFTNFMLITLSEVISPRMVSILPALMLTLWIIGIAWLMYEASRFSGQAWDKLLISSLTFLLVFMALLQAPNRFQILYWRSSMSAHFAPLVCMPYLFAALTRSIGTAEKKPPALWVYPLVFLASFMIGGFSEPAVMVMISLLALAIFCTWFWMKRSARSTALTLLPISLAGAALALIVMAFAPAREFRLANATPPTLPVVFMRTFDYGFDFILNSFRTLPLPTVFTLLIPFLIFYGLYAVPAPTLTSGQRKLTYILLVATPIVSYLLIVASFLPSTYGQSFPVPRARFSGQLCLVTGLMTEAALLGILSAQIRSRLAAKLPLKPIVALALILSSLYLLRAAWLTALDIPVYSERAYWWDVRDGMIHEAIAQGQTKLFVQQFDGVEGVKEMDVNANHWVNRCVAKYYGVKSVRAYPDVIFP
jgi:hypothetical protein